MMFAHSQPLRLCCLGCHREDPAGQMYLAAAAMPPPSWNGTQRRQVPPPPPPFQQQAQHVPQQPSSRLGGYTQQPHTAARIFAHGVPPPAAPPGPASEASQGEMGAAAGPIV